MNRRLLTLVATLAAPAGMACHHNGPRSPEALNETYRAALADNDPDAAYALLAPEVQAQVDPKEFRQRWARDTAERRAVLAAAETESVVARREAVTTHEGGRVLTWTQAGDEYLVVSGLPGIPRTDTPAAAVRALIASMRDGDLARLQGVASAELLDALRESWDTRAKAIETALKKADSLQVSEDGLRAELKYGAAEAIRLEQTPHGWRITGLE